VRILMTIHHELDRNSGAPGVTLELAGSYRALGHEVDVVAFDDLPSWVPDRLRTAVFPPYVGRELYRRPLVDVVEASTGDAWIWCEFRRLVRRRGSIVATQSHGLEHVAHAERMVEAARGAISLGWRYRIYYGHYNLWQVNRSLRGADLAFFLNRHDQEYALAHLGVRSERSHVIPNGIPGWLLGRPVEAGVGSPVRIAQVGSYLPTKGVEYSAPALRQLLAERQDVHVSFLGTGVADEVVLSDFPAQLHPRIHVVQRFEHRQLPELLTGHEIKLLPSITEGFGVSLLEAMACGLSPVATRAHGPVDIVRDGENGLLVPSRDSNAIHFALERLIADCELRQRLRRAAHATAQEYGWRRIAERRLDLYRAVARSGRSAAEKADVLEAR
jgi:glycosyltransferase involved in cell wall biosynthesis